MLYGGLDGMNLFMSSYHPNETQFYFFRLEEKTLIFSQR